MPLGPNLKYVFLDFDETLFNHLAFMNWVDGQLHKRGHLPEGKGSLRGTIDEYHTILSKEPLLRLYRHEEHVSNMTDQNWTNVSKLISQLVAEQQLDFCYPDAHELLSWLGHQPLEVRILTFGDDSYQQFKIHTCQYLSDHKIPIHVVHESKAIFLARHFAHHDGLLVDDKYPMLLPKNWHHVWIDRRAGLAKPKVLSDNEIKISSLDQVKDVVKRSQN